MSNKIAIISPSGKFYGSEQTLYEFLNETSKKFDVYIKSENEGLLSKISKESKHSYFEFSNLYLLYLKLILKLIFQYDVLYINEAGHIKYVKILARLFHSKKFVIHVRLTEDTKFERLKNINSNIKLISVSRYIQELILKSIGKQTDVLSSPFRAKDENASWPKSLHNKEVMDIGVIGRVTSSKGIHNCISFIEYLEKNNHPLTINFFGDINNEDLLVKKLMDIIKELKFVKIKFHGFIRNKKGIFENSDVIVHFNENEPLGVVFFEALNNKTPFIGFNSGGIGEIASKLDLNNFIVNEKEWEKELFKQLKSIDLIKYKKAYENMLKYYSPNYYSRKLECLLFEDSKKTITK